MLSSENEFHIDTRARLMTELPQIRSATTYARGERRTPVTVTAPDGVYYDPYDVQINADPYRAFRAIPEESPLYYNEQHDFYALSRFADVDRALVDHETFSSARGAIIELIKANIDIPPGVIIFERSHRSRACYQLHVRRRT